MLHQTLSTHTPAAKTPMNAVFLILLTSLPLAAAPNTVTVAGAVPWEKSITLPVEAVPYYRVDLGTPANGWIVKVSADVGTRVKTGDLLGEIRAPELTAASDARAEEAKAAKQKVVQAEAMLQSAGAKATAAQSEFDRIQQLAKSGTVTTKASDEAESRMASANAMVGEAKAAVAGAGAEVLAAEARAIEAAATVAFTRITAPFDGLVVERNAELGDYLAGGGKSQKLFVVEQTDPLRLRLQIPEHAASMADAGDAVTVKLGGRAFTAKLLRVAGSLDPVTRTMTAEAELSGSGILPGSFGSAVLKLAKLENAVLVPAAAVKNAPDGTSQVLVLDGADTKPVNVKVFAVDGVSAVLSDGPPTGSKVVVP